MRASSMSRASQSAQFIAAPLPRLDSPSTPERWSGRAQLDRGGDGRPKAGEAMTEASSLRPVQTFRQYSGDGDLSHSAIYRGQPGLSHRRGMWPRFDPGQAFRGVCCVYQSRDGPTRRRKAVPASNTPRALNFDVMDRRPASPGRRMHGSHVSQHFSLP
ncbi:hypothetical protein BGZ61DRAFT_98941 [Ilyonectria robusta]|uniref:uncharacterized protein n=1 Tax=Ilyonectria robusta TaxID=1079257 RepID=UPI001E8E3696|nr:uncharacterized protein BGZ61DRAFT_98941 [Ilyonectria robusta]KAH8675029.1 hypothetical protein BGZ61DRAFT_98941 [Ilyonectria robusta]